MEKRYQVFISSTVIDLKEERQAVSQALLKSDCFPAQMENWPAMDAQQMEVIKEIIQESDYYLVISAGKYGSIDPATGLSYTELEYDYAMEIGKPVIRLLRSDPFKALPGERIESTASGKKKLKAFQAKLREGKVCKFWENADQLQTETIVSLVDIKKRHPALGWVRANGKASKDAELEIASLKLELAESKIRHQDPVSSQIGRHEKLQSAFFTLFGSDKREADLLLISLLFYIREEKYDEKLVKKVIEEQVSNLSKRNQDGVTDDIRDILVALEIIEWVEGKGWSESKTGEVFDSYVRAQKFFNTQPRSAP